MADTQKYCPDCGVKIGVAHRDNCDVARCLECGSQRLSCDCAEPGAQRWTGEWPGIAECREFGWYILFSPSDGWTRCGADQIGATEDLNRLYIEAVWNKEQGRFVRQPA